MAQLSTSPEEWSERAALSNYRCQGCRTLITFEDQNLYFIQGYCASCFESCLTGVKIHGWEALIVQTVLRIGRMYPLARPRIVYECALNLSHSWRITGKQEVIP